MLARRPDTTGPLSRPINDSLETLDVGAVAGRALDSPVRDPPPGTVSSHECSPIVLDAPLELNPSKWTKLEVYDLITSLVVPRPVAWVSTVGPDGIRNLAPHSYFALVADDPPHVAFSSIGVKDTLRNIRATGEFVVNIASRRILSALDATAADLAPSEDEFTFASLTAQQSRVVRAPRVAEASAHLECRVTSIASVGNGNLVVGRVLHIHVDPSVWAQGRVSAKLLDPVVRLSRRYGALSRTYTPEEEPSAHVINTAPAEAKRGGPPP